MYITNAVQIPSVDFIVQFDPPDNARDYIHRVGRTARGSGTKGRSLLFLQVIKIVQLGLTRNQKC